MIFVDQFYNKQFINDRNTAENSNVKSDRFTDRLFESFVSKLPTWYFMIGKLDCRIHYSLHSVWLSYFQQLIIQSK